VGSAGPDFVFEKKNKSGDDEFDNFSQWLGGRPLKPPLATPVVKTHYYNLQHEAQLLLGDRATRKHAKDS